MMRMLTICCALMIAMTFSVDQAEAKRFGGGGSFGKMFSTSKKSAPAPKQVSPTKSTNQAAATSTAKPRSGLGGMMGGLLAGGILGAMFFGGAFEGIQMMDILIVGLIGFVLFRFLGRMKQSQQKPQYAGGYQPDPQSHQPQQRQAADADAGSFEPTPLMSNRLAEAELELPSWFKKDAFLEGARAHFTGLQQAWNRNDLDEISDYCDPELFKVMQAEREKLGTAELDNEVVSVMAEVIGFAERNECAELSVNFYGWMREGTDAQSTEFNEIWHLTRDTTVADSDWFIVGIEQP
ncbi:MAG: TIM44-like domain-containing protein [Motiliproteus sp.]